MILYDRYDLWVVDLTGKTKTNCLTKGYGRETQRTFRWLKRDYDEKIIDLKKDLLLEFTKVDNGDQGIYRFTPESKFVRLIEGPFAVNVYQLSKMEKIVSGRNRVTRNSVICGGAERLQTSPTDHGR